MTDTTSTAGSGDHSAIATELELLKTDALGRVKVPPVKRELILDAFERSGLSGQAFAEHIGVKYPTFATWVQKRKRARGDYPKGCGKSVKAPLALVEAVVEQEFTASPAPSLEVEAPGGIKLRLGRREDIALAVSLLQALKSC